MTDSIKPPGSGPALPPRVHADEGASRTDPSSVERGATTQVASAAATTAATSTNATHAALLAQLQAGTIDAAQVIDALVTKALDQAAAQGLPSSERAQLETVLRSALAEDPALSGWARDLER